MHACMLTYQHMCMSVYQVGVKSSRKVVYLLLMCIHVCGEGRGVDTCQHSMHIHVYVCVYQVGVTVVKEGVLPPPHPLPPPNHHRFHLLLERGRQHRGRCECSGSVRVAVVT